MLRFHDFNLEGYEVSQFGTRIVLHLVLDAPGKESERSDICFSDVALYNFTHTAGAIVTDIEECSVSDLLDEIGVRVVEWNRLHGIRQWGTSFGSYKATIRAAGYRAWRIESAVGFAGFVIAKEVAQLDA